MEEGGWDGGGIGGEEGREGVGWQGGREGGEEMIRKEGKERNARTRKKIKLRNCPTLLAPSFRVDKNGRLS